MARRKKKAWNMSNPLYRYLHGKKAKTKTKKRTRKRGISMARRKKHSRKSFGGGSLMNGIIRPKGLIASALIGAGAATMVENMGFTPLGNLSGVGAGFATAGVGGAVGAFARDALKGKLGGLISGSTSSEVYA
jgi:hypothetical protein